MATSYEQKLLCIPYEKLAKADAWEYEVDGVTKVAKYGIRIQNFGFGSYVLPDGILEDGVQLPSNFNRDLYASYCKNKVITKNITGVLLSLGGMNFLPAQTYVHRPRLLELLNKFNHAPISLVKFDNFYWCINGHHRLMVQKLLGNYVLANVEIVVNKKYGVR